jgi:hypothetical protein
MTPGSWVGGTGTVDGKARTYFSADPAVVGLRGNSVILVTDRQLPYPYGREVAGYAVPT